MFGRKRTLASIIANFDHMIAELQALDAQHGADHQRIEAEIARLHVKKNDLIAERQQAAVIATNLRALTGQSVIAGQAA